jgi:hypothetical protein
LNCYDYLRVANDLVAADGITPQRYWPAELYNQYLGVQDAGLE